MQVQFAELPALDQDRAKKFYCIVAELRDSEGNRLILESR